MRTMRFGRSRWQRRAGAVAFVMAGAILLASCSSGPTGVAAISAAAQARAKAAVVKTVQFPSGPVAEHIYGPSWARFVAAFPGKVVVGVSDKVSSCAIGSPPQYDATAGTPLTGSEPRPPSYDVLIWRCATAGEAAALVRGKTASLAMRKVAVDGVHGLADPLQDFPLKRGGAPEWVGGDLFRVAAIVYVDEAFVVSTTTAHTFIGAFHLGLAGYTPAPVK